MALTALGIGDLHLPDDKGTGGLAKYIDRPERYVMSEVSRVVEWGIARYIYEVWFYGDFCQNPRMSYEAIMAFVKVIRKYPQVTFRGILGNHDKIAEASKAGHSMQIIMDYQLPNLKIYTEDTIELIQGVNVKFCPWPSIALNNTCLNVAHKEVSGSLSDSGRVMKASDLSTSKAVAVIGHLHTKHRVRNSYFSGTLYQTNFGESSPKFFHHIQFKDAKDYEISDIPFKPRYVLHNCIVETQADVDALPQGKYDLLKVVVKDGADIVIPDMPNIVVSKAFKTQDELKTILTEDLIEGSELIVRSDDFFTHWLANLNVDSKVKKRAASLRKEILNGSK